MRFLRKIKVVNVYVWKELMLKIELNLINYEVENVDGSIE